MARSNHSRRVLAATVAACAAFGLAACSDSPSEPDKKVTVAPKTDEDKLVDLAGDFWAVRTSSQNSGNTDPAQFTGILSAEMTEVEVTMLNQYKKLGVTRSGAPEVTDIEASVDGDEGAMLMCLNEDDWGVVVEDDPDFEQPDNGVVPFGTTAEKDADGRWVVTGTLKAEDKRVKAKSC